MEWIVIWIWGVAFVRMLLSKRAASTSPAMLRRYLQEGALVIDVRSPEEFRSGHGPNSINIPLDELRDSLPRRVPDKSQVLLLHCLSGGRSGIARHQLKSLGCTNVFNLGSLARARQIVAGASGPEPPARA